MPTVKELREEAKELEITGYSSMDKDQLIDAVHEGRVLKMDDDHTLEELHEMASEEGIEGRSSMNKLELAEALVTKSEEEDEEQEGDDAESRDTGPDRPSALRDLPETEPAPEGDEPTEEPQVLPSRQVSRGPNRVGEPRAGVRGEVRGSRARQGPVPRTRTIGKTSR